MYLFWVRCYAKLYILLTCMCIVYLWTTPDIFCKSLWQYSSYFQQKTNQPSCSQASVGDTAKCDATSETTSLGEKAVQTCQFAILLTFWIYISRLLFTQGKTQKLLGTMELLLSNQHYPKLSQLLPRSANRGQIYYDVIILHNTACSNIYI